ncbi:uncharacterized protein B0P05DRAFT_526668 [Gilbertella persicaria]|uniref:uncharacterized protein n=1 Tax=Gilbertella persicaria TaxID=101096 RepID=UPI00221F28F7|nr:uncharacterized protein B0P05DRAFT_526668 [Gilbertella persicaria]KAI8091241.1 hypothetical protein B0P05DRAFT_526668 [Gilbertella persicaria]
MQYTKHGIYNFVREDKVSIKEDSNDREEQLASLVSFLLNLKVYLDKTTKAIASLKTEHDEKEKCYDSETNSQLVLLSEIICPDIFKSSFNTHGQHFAQEHFKSSPESDY